MDPPITESDCTSVASAAVTTPPSRVTPAAPASATARSLPEPAVADKFLEVHSLGASATQVYPNLLPSVHRRPAPDTDNPVYRELFNRVIHPYNTAEFQRLLMKHNLSEQYPQLVRNLSNGFPLGRIPKLERTIIIENHPSTAEHKDAVQEYIKEELEKNRMSGPFTLDQMEEICRGPFYCSPMIVVLQEQGPGLEPKKRVCRHLSKDDRASGTPSVNSFIDKADFPTRFDSALDVATLISKVPVGTQACAFDIKAFHRTCPVLPEHKPFLVARSDDGFFLDHCYPFGSASASSNAGQICRALIDIWRAETRGDAETLGYEDDLASLRLPNKTGPFRDGSYLYRLDRDTAFALIASLDTPWHPIKSGKKYEDTMVFLGFMWDLTTRRVSLHEPKRLKYLARVVGMIKSAKSSQMFSLLELQEIHGTLCHIAQLRSAGTSLWDSS